MRKSVTAFVFGLIGSIFSIMWGFIFGIVGDSVSCIASSAGAASPDVVNTLMILGWLCFIGGIVGIIGASMCFKSARKGGIVLSCATVACGSLLIYLFAQSAKAGEMIPTLVLVFLLPLIFLVVADVSAFVAKKRESFQPNIQYGPIPQNAQPAGKSLEQELTELKAMFEKGLLDEEEYNQTRKSIIAKHTK